MAAKAHPPLAEEENAPSVRYDVTLKVGNTEYVVLFVPPDGTLRDIVQYRLGMDGLVLVGADTIKYNDMLIAGALVLWSVAIIEMAGGDDYGCQGSSAAS